MSQLSKPITLADDVLIDQVAAGALLGIPPKTLQKWRSTHETNLPYIRIGRAIRYRTTDLKAFIDANTHNKVTGGEK